MALAQGPQSLYKGWGVLLKKTNPEMWREMVRGGKHEAKGRGATKLWKAEKLLEETTFDGQTPA
jgi:hypothetical protein